MDENQLCDLLSVDRRASTKKVLEAIGNEGFIPAEIKQSYGGNTEFICGIYRKTDRERINDPMPGFPTARMAALNGLRLARGLPSFV